MTQVLGTQDQTDVLITPPSEPSSERKPGSPWWGFALRRTVGLSPAFFVIITITFLIVPLIPGDPAVQVAGVMATSDEVDRMRHELGLDLPLWQQYADYLSGVLSGDLGQSFMFHQPVSSIVITRLGYTAALAVAAMILVVLVSIPLGIAIAIATRGGRRTRLDAWFNASTGLFSTIPSYVLGTVLVVVFANQLGLVPPAYSKSSPVSSAILPTIALSVGAICTFTRVVRREAANALEQDYMRTARGWRIPPVPLMLKYLLPNILTVSLTLGGLILTALLGGAVIVETVFAWPGLGTAVVSSILNRDYPLIRGLILVLGLLASIITLIVDIILGIVDSRTLGGKNAR